MAESSARPLRLRREEFRDSDYQPALIDPVVNVWVDSGVAHLDGIYSYLVPERLTESITAGIRISVTFNGRDVEALVIERTSVAPSTGLKYVSKVLSPVVVAPEKLIKFIGLVTRRWLCHPYDVIRSAIPPRSAGAEKEFLEQLPEPRDNPISDGEKIFIHIQPGDDAIEKLAQFAKEKAQSSSVLVIVPEERDLLRLASLLGESAITISGASSRSERYQSYLAALHGRREIVIGTRSAIFSFSHRLKTMIIFKEASQSHYEVRYPGWNVRDLALLRAEMESLDLYFVGHCPSAEVGWLIATQKMNFLSSRVRMKVTNLEPISGQLLPDRIFSPIRNALKTGPVLFLVPRKGYASSLLCKKCKNIATCPCGGRISRKEKSADGDCVHCGSHFAELKCRWCFSSDLSLLGRGGERHSEEIGRAFPGFPVLYSTADVPIAEIAEVPALVIATAGMAPRAKHGYSSVVLLEGDSFFSGADLRAQERARESFFEAAALCKPAGEVITVVSASNPISTALSMWSPLTMVDRELSDRKEVSLPPFVRALLIDVESKQATEIADGIRRSVSDARLPPSTRVLGPAERVGDLSRIIVSCNISESVQLLDFMHQYLRRRAIAKKGNLTLRVDPYSLS